jgi:tetratricopeptide (TPR) repeat protein
MLEAVKTRLSALRGVYVVDADAEIGGAISLEGSLQREGDRVRITYRLVDRQGVRLAGRLLEGDIDELFELQDRVTEEITAALVDQFDLDEAVSDDPSRPTPDVLAYELYLQARGCLRDYDDPGNIEIAIDLFQKALERDPDFALAYSGLADAYWKRWDETKDAQWTRLAEEASRTALEKGADYAEIHVTLGTIYRETGKFPHAAQEFRRAIAIDDQNDAAYIGLALTHEAMGDNEAAIGTFNRATEARPDYWGNLSQLGAFYVRHGRFDDALVSFEKVVALTPENAKAYSNIGAVRLRLGDVDGAIEAFNRSLAIRPNYRAYSNLAYLYRSQGRMEEAAETIEKALILDPQDYRVWGNLGATYLAIPGKRAEADSATRRAIELAEPLLEVNPRNATLLALLAQYYETINEPHRALRLVERAVELAPDQVEVLFYAAGVYLGMKDQARALDTIRKALEAGLTVEALAQEPGFDSLMATPEFRRIVEELH